MHRAAWTDPVFLGAYSVEPIAFCRGCHAPEGGRLSASVGPGRHVGVGCVTCHVLGDRVAGTVAVSATADHHAVVARPEMRTEAWCASCHQFDFPEPQEALMQSTVSEHGRSQHRDKTCVDCHMVEVDGHRSHRFAVVGDEALLRSAVSATAQLSGERNLDVTLRVAAAGHDVPTGDMFRRLVVRATAAGDNEAVDQVLARTFRREQRGEDSLRVQTGDDRLPASGAPRTLSLFFLRPIAAPVAWEVVYQRMGPHEAALFGVDLSADETVLASGVITTVPEETK